MSVRYESVKLSDLAQINQIETSSFKDPWTDKMFQEVINNDHYHLNKLVSKSAIIGYICYILIANEEAHIANVAIEDSYRNKGFGEILVKSFIAEIKQKKIISATLEVRESNFKAIALYEKCGFINYGIRPKYYDNNENAIIMWLNL